MAKSKLNLHAYQQDILARLKVATEGGGVSSSSKLGIKVGEANCLVSLADVNEVLPVPQIMAVPLTQPWFMGIANVRGLLYSITDLSALQSKVSTVVTRESRVLLAHQRFEMNVGLLISQLIGLRNLADMQIQPELSDKPIWQLSRYQDSQGQVWDEIDMRLLLNQQEFMQVAA